MSDRLKIDDLLLLLLLAIPGCASFSLHRKHVAIPEFRERLIRNNYSYAFGISLGDIDGDGDLDIGSSDCCAHDRIHWLENQGCMNFAEHLVTGYAPGRVEKQVMADLNGDGHLDILLAENDPGSISYYQNPGPEKLSQEWKRVTISNDMPGAYRIRTADLDGDSFLDLVASGWEGNQLAVFFGDGKGKYEKQVLDESLKQIMACEVEDINLDGKPDIVATGRLSHMLAWYENVGSRHFVRHVIDQRDGLAPHLVKVADLDGDGDPDVAMITRDLNYKRSYLLWYENLGGGNQWKPHTIDRFKAGSHLAIGDLNNDGRPDIVATGSARGTLIIYFSEGNDRWTKKVLKKHWINAAEILLADLDRDGDLDILASAENGSNEVRVWENRLVVGNCEPNSLQ